MTERLRIGIVGGGLIAQVEHIPNILALRSLFDLRAVSDPSPTIREHLGRRFGVATVADASELLALDLHAILIAAPDPWHFELALAAIAAGLHVFCEKPLCYGVAEIDRLAVARDSRNVVVQVGYMKRFDPSYEAALERVAGKAEGLRYIGVEINDPDAAPFVAHLAPVSAADMSAGLRAETTRRRREQVEAALGFPPDDTIFRGFTGAYCSALVHDVNIVHGLLDAIGACGGRVAGAAIFAGGAGGQATVSLRDGQALWNMAHFELPGVADYRERISLYFEDEIVELVFPAPYLNHHPTRLTVRRSDGRRLEICEIRVSYEEPFLRELEAFWSTIVQGAPQRNTIEQAGRDQALLVEMARRASVGSA